MSDLTLADREQLEDIHTLKLRIAALETFIYEAFPDQIKDQNVTRSLGFTGWHFMLQNKQKTEHEVNQKIADLQRRGYVVTKQEVPYTESFTETGIKVKTYNLQDPMERKVYHGVKD